MISREAAASVVKAYLKSLSQVEDDPELILIEDATMERGFGWVFFYQSAKFLESGDFSDRFAGNSPIIVDRSDGSLHETGTAHPIQVYLDRYEEHGDPFAGEPGAAPERSPQRGVATRGRL